MSRSRNPQPLGAILKDVIDRMGLSARLKDEAVIAAWVDVAGPRIETVTERVWLDGDRLIVKVRSAPWRQELHLNRTSWRNRINQHLGREAIREIVFR